MEHKDRLGPAKEVAQIGAAIGREFSHALLAAVTHKAEAESPPPLPRLRRPVHRRRSRWRSFISARYVREMSSHIEFSKMVEGSACIGLRNQGANDRIYWQRNRLTPAEPLQHHAHTCRHAGEFQIVAGENVPRVHSASPIGSPLFRRWRRARARCRRRSDGRHRPARSRSTGWYAAAASAPARNPGAAAAPPERRRRLAALRPVRPQGHQGAFLRLWRNGGGRAEVVLLILQSHRASGVPRTSKGK